MNVVTTMTVLPNTFTPEQNIKRLHDIGFDCLDIGFEQFLTPDHPFRYGDHKAWATELRRYADSLGVRFTHAHCCADADYRGPEIFRAIECAGILGVKIMAVHPVAFRCPADIPKNIGIEDDEEFMALNVKAFRELMPYAEQNGVILVAENLLWGSSYRFSNFVRLVKEVNSPYLGWCLDTGHAHYCGVKMTELLDLDTPPLSLHIQDNRGYLTHDDHLLPGDGTIDWKEFAELLVKIGYTGDTVLEAHHQSIEAPDDKRDAILTDLYQRGVKLNDYIMKLKQQ